MTGYRPVVSRTRLTSTAKALTSADVHIVGEALSGAIARSRFGVGLLCFRAAFCYNRGGLREGGDP